MVGDDNVVGRIGNADAHVGVVGRAVVRDQGTFGKPRSRQVAVISIPAPAIGSRIIHVNDMGGVIAVKRDPRQMGTVKEVLAVLDVDGRAPFAVARIHLIGVLMV